MNPRMSGLARVVASAVLGLLTLAAWPAMASEPVDLNAASPAELIELPGIGPSKADAIVRHREEHPFRSVDELLNVPGIGPSTFENLRERVEVGGSHKG